MEARAIPTMPGYTVTRDGIVYGPDGERKHVLRNSGHYPPSINWKRRSIDGSGVQWARKTLRAILCETWHPRTCGCGMPIVPQMGRSNRALGKPNSMPPTLDNLRASYARFQFKGTCR